MEIRRISRYLENEDLGYICRLKGKINTLLMYVPAQLQRLPP